MRKISLYNEFHLGDNLFTLQFLNKYKNEDYEFDFYINENYIPELKKHLKNNNVNLLNLQDKTEDSYNMWIGHDMYYFVKIGEFNCNFDLFYVDFFNMTASKLGIEPKFESNLDLLFDNSNYEVSLDKTFDYLVINSVPLSGQFSYHESDFINLCDYLNSNNKTFITTKKVGEYECTLDYNMSLVDIGNLSNSVNNIIAVNTAPIVTTFTPQNINKIDKRFILDNWLKYSYNERIYSLNHLSYIYDKL